MSSRIFWVPTYSIRAVTIPDTIAFALLSFRRSASLHSLSMPKSSPELFSASVTPSV